VAQILNTKRLGGPVNSLNDIILADFTTILDHQPVEKCEYILDCIKKAVNEDVNPERYSYLNNRMRVKIGELVAKYFNYRHDVGDILINIIECLKKNHYFENIESMKRIDSIHSFANLLS
jgi:hypothetical protein